ncbi:pyridoxal-phosphate dependent enzyme [Actinoallomurus sp. NBC_01490]|uniref:PLP-dependent cysteine synthase family protein n=1 Tax=Actinoallomurus sp. NBC_01490 TaxID=2903557 RepID=UPI002E374056|nr:pyridoxal-phosphate dependent enzyme [Actinoallomurus sp. NBC_01490]
MGSTREWAAAGIARIERDVAATPLRSLPTPPEWGVGLSLKDESAQPTGSVKHRLLAAAYVQALAAGQITEGTTVVVATAGPAAVAGAHFARTLGLDFVAVVPRRTREDRIAAIEAAGGRVHPHDPPAAIYDEARRLAAGTGGFHLDHFAVAAQVIDWRDGNIAAEIFADLGSPPRWIVTGAGTGATSATIGRFLRHHGHETMLAVADPENSAYFPGWASGATDYATGMPSRVEGIGRPRMEPGFLPSAVDLVIPVPDAASAGALAWLREHTGIAAGASTGTCLWAAWRLIAEMRAEGRRGEVVVIQGDAGRPPGLDGSAYTAAIERFLAIGELDVPA